MCIYIQNFKEHSFDHIASCNSNVSAVKVILTTLFSFLGCQANNIYFPFLPCRNTRSPPCEPPYFKFAKEASLKQTNDAFYKSLICGNDKTSSLHFNNLINLFAVTRFLTVASLVELLTTIAA